MIYLKLYQIKRHLNIDERFQEDDEYLLELAEVAQAMVEKHLDTSLQNIAKDNGGTLPPPIVHAMKLLVAEYYSQREAISYTSTQVVPLAYDYLLAPYIDYKPKKELLCKRDCLINQSTSTAPEIPSTPTESGQQSGSGTTEQEQESPTPPHRESL